MQSAKGEPGAQRQAEAVATKADSAFTPELPATELPRAQLPAVDAPADGRFVVRAVEVMPLPPRRGAPVVSRADLFGAVSLASLIPLIAVLLGWLWSRLAPAQLSVVQEDLSLAALPIQSQHRFDDLATFVLLGAVAGLLVGAATWLVRGRRGPLTVLGLAVGSLLAAWLAVRMGVSFAHAHYPQPPTPLTPGAIVAEAPRLESNWVIIVQPLFAALAYGIAAAANGLEDLGRRLS